MADDLEDDGFKQIMARICNIVGAKNQIELAGFFGVRQSAVSDAKRRRRVPSDWLMTLLRSKNINPDWILTGKGATLMNPPSDRYETTYEFQERREAELAVRRLPSRMLAEELLRRIALSKLDGFG